MKKIINRLKAFLRKVPKKIFSKRILLTVFLPLAVILALYLSRSLIFAAWVNGKPIYRYSLTRELEKQGGRQILDGLIEKSLVDAEAGKNNIKVLQSDIDSQITTIEKKVTSQGISLDDALGLRGMTREDLAGQIKTQIIVEKILSSKIKIDEKELKDYFNANKSLFGQNPVFDKVKEQVRNQLFQQKLSAEYNSWITDLKNKAKILYFVNL